MTTYNTYQEAKIANPDSDIYLDESVFRTWRAGQIKSGTKCNPADHCMTVEQFLKDGHKFVEGDVAIGASGNLIHVDCSNAHRINSLASEDKMSIKLTDREFILRAAALEKPKRVKVEYVKVDFEKTIEMIDGDFCIYSDLFFMWSETNVVPISQVTGKDLVLNRHKLYRRIETEISERGEFIEAANSVKLKVAFPSREEFAVALYESGMFKLSKGGNHE